LEIERAFIHYARALDATDMGAAFLKLWSVLEQISAAGGERYDTLIERAAFMFEAGGITKYVLEHLRYQRNQIVHLGTPQSELRPLVYQTKRFVEKMLGVHLQLGKDFATLQEAGQFMNLGHDRDALNRRAWLVRQAMKFRTGTRARSKRR